jgi:hypothetical protein
VTRRRRSLDHARAFLIVAAALSGSPRGIVRADEIVVAGTNHAHVKIVGMDNGVVRFRSPDGLAHDAALETVEWFEVDRRGAFVDFNQAERLLAGGDPAKAASRYLRSARASEGFWTDLITARLLIAYDRAGQIERATSTFIRVMRGRWTGVAAAARMIPESIPTRRDAETGRCVDQLSAALVKTNDASERALMSLLQFEILQATGDDRAGSAARRVVQLTIPPEATSRRVYAIMLSALRAALDSDPSREALAGLERCISGCAESALPGFLLLKGRVMMARASTREDIIRASWPLMRIVAHMPDDALAAEGLYETALALERIGRRDQATALLVECAAHPRVAEELRRSATAALDRLRGDGE